MSTLGASVPRCFMCCHFGDPMVQKKRKEKGEREKKDEVVRWMRWRWRDTKRGKMSDGWRDEWGKEVHNICFFGLPLTSDALGRRGICILSHSSSCSQFLSKVLFIFSISELIPWKKLVNIDEGHPGSLLNRGQDEKRETVEWEGCQTTAPTGDFISSLKCATYLRVCLFASSRTCTVQPRRGEKHKPNSHYPHTWGSSPR